VVDFSLPRQSIEAVAGPLSEEQAVLLTAYGEAILKGSREINVVSRRSHLRTLSGAASEIWGVVRVSLV